MIHLRLVFAIIMDQEQEKIMIKLSNIWKYQQKKEMNMDNTCLDNVLNMDMAQKRITKKHFIGI